MNMKRNFLLLIVCTLFTFNVHANDYDFERNGILYLVSNYGDVKITGYTNDVSSNLEIPQTVTYLGQSYSVTNIDDYAFQGCSAITTLVVHNNIKSLGFSVFTDCYNLKSVNIEKGGITSLPGFTFSGCTKLTAVSLPNDITQINDCAFQNCPFTTIKLPTNLTSLSGEVFRRCDNLKTITIPASVSYMSSAFNLCYSLESIVVEPQSKNYVSEDGVLYDISKTKLIKYPCMKTQQKYDIPNTVTSIADYAFYQCSNLTRINFPSNLISIGALSFHGCRLVEDLSLPSTVSTIGWGAFGDCTSIKKMIIPDNVDIIKQETFYGCSSLEEIDLPEKLSKCSFSSFGGCSALREIKISGSNKHFYIENNIVYNMVKDSLLFYPSALMHESFITPSNIKVLGEYSLCSCTNLKKITITNNIEKLSFKCLPSSLESIYVQKITPPSADEWFLEDSKSWNYYKQDHTDWTKSKNQLLTLYVPTGTTESYSTSTGWDGFVYVKELLWDDIPLSFPVLAITTYYEPWASTNKTNNSISTKTYCFNVSTEDILSFDWNTSCEVNNDKFTTKINGITVLTKSGLNQSGNFTKIFDEEKNVVLDCSYSKNGSISKGNDVVNVTNIKLLNYSNKDNINKIRLSENINKIDISKVVSINELTYSRIFNTTNWQTLYIPFSISYNDWKENFEIARLNDVHQYDDNEDGNIDRTELEVIKVKNGSLEPNTPYLIKAKTIGEKNITVNNATLYNSKENSFDVTSWNTKFTFTGTYSTIDGQTMLDNGYYAMGNNGRLVQAKSANSNLGTFRWYLSITDRNGNKKDLNSTKICIFCIDDEEATSINSIDTDIDINSKIYDLTGRYIGTNKSELKSGIYIQNGKKYNVK